MDKIKKSCLFKVISLILILTFISLDVSWAYPPEHNTQNSTLAIPSVLQQQPVNEHAARFQRSVFSQGALIASVYDIGEYFFGNAEKNKGPLPSKHIQDVVKSDIRKHLSDAGAEILNIVPVEHIKQTAPEELKTALDEIGFKGTLPDEGVVFILYKQGDKKFLVQIAKSGEVSPANLPGYDWVISDKYVVKYMPEDYTGPVEPSQSSLRGSEATEAPRLRSGLRPELLSKDEATSLLEAAKEAPKLHSAEEAELIALVAKERAVITIDGTAGTGKSTLASDLAEKLGIGFFSYGKIYRLAAWFAKNAGFALSDNMSPGTVEELGQLLKNIDADKFAYKKIDGEDKYFYDGKDISIDLENASVANAAPFIAKVPQLRAVLIACARKIIARMQIENNGVVLEGRVTGIELMPDANLKIFLIADLSERAIRRAKQLKNSIGIEALYKSLFAKEMPSDKTEDDIWREIVAKQKEDILQRDRTDEQREYMPFAPPQGSYEINTSKLIAKETLDIVLAKLHNVLAPKVTVTEPIAEVSVPLAGTESGPSIISRDAITNLQNTLRSSNAIYADIVRMAQKNEARVSAIGEVFPDFDELESVKKWSSNFLQHTLEFIKTLEMIKNNDAAGINKVKEEAKRELLKPGVVDEYNKLFQKLFSHPEDREHIFLTALLHDIGARDGTVGHEDKGAVWISNNLPAYYKDDALFVEKMKWLIGQHVAVGTMFFGERTPDRLLRLLDELPGQLKDYKEELLGALAIITFCDGGAMIDNNRAEYYINTDLSTLEKRKPGFLVYRLQKLAGLKSEDEKLVSKELGKLYDILGEKGKAIFIKQVSENLDALDYGLAFTGSIVKGIDNPEERFELILKIFCMLAFIADTEDERGEDIKWWVEFVGLNAEGDKVAATLTPEHVRALKGLEFKELTFEKIQPEYQSKKPLFGIFKVDRGIKIFESKPAGKGRKQHMLSISVNSPIAEVSAPIAGTGQQDGIKNRIFSIRAITMLSALITALILALPQFAAAATGDSTYSTVLDSIFSVVKDLFGLAALSSIFSAIKDFASVHPIIAEIAAFVIGTAVFLTLWRIFYPERWHLQHIKSMDPYIARIAKAAFYKKDAQATTSLIRALNSSDESIRAAAAEALFRLKDPRLSFMGQYLTDMAIFGPDYYVKLTNDDIDFVLLSLEKGLPIKAKYIPWMTYEKHNEETPGITESRFGHGGQNCYDVIDRAELFIEKGNIDQNSIAQNKAALEGIIAASLEEIAKRKEISHKDLFALVQSKVPESMQNLKNALAELKPLSEQKEVTADAISAGIKQAKEKYSLTDEETKILWLALTGPGQGGGENDLYIPKSVDEAYAAVIATLLKIGTDHKYYIFKPKIDKSKVEKALLTGRVTCVGSVIFGYDADPYSNESPITVNFSEGSLVFGSIEDYEYGDVTRDTIETPAVTERADNEPILKTISGLPVTITETTQPFCQDPDNPMPMQLYPESSSSSAAAGQIFTREQISIIASYLLPQERPVAIEVSAVRSQEVDAHTKMPVTTDEDKAPYVVEVTFRTDRRNVVISEIKSYRHAKDSALPDHPRYVAVGDDGSEPWYPWNQGTDGSTSEIERTIEKCCDDIIKRHEEAKAAETLIKIGAPAIPAVMSMLKYTDFQSEDPDLPPIDNGGHVRSAAKRIMEEITKNVVAAPQAKEKHSLTDEETKILWLALTGPGQGNHGATHLFEIVESALVNEREKFIDTSNKLINSLPAESDPEAADKIGALDTDMATAEIKERVKRAIEIASSLTSFAPRNDDVVEYLKKNLDQFEADGALASLIILARRAQRENQKLIIALETDWIPAMSMGSLQQNAIVLLMKEIDAIGEALKSMGLDNVEIIHESAGNLADKVLDRANQTHTDLRNVIVMGSMTTITSLSFAPLRDADENNRPFLAGIDPTEILKFYETFGETISNQLHIRLTEMLYMALELAAGKEPPQLPIIVSYDEKMRLVIFLPKAEPMEYEALKKAYKAEQAALAAA